MYFVPGHQVLVLIFLLILRSNINNALILKILNTWARKGFGMQRHSACQLPSLSHMRVGKSKTS